MSDKTIVILVGPSGSGKTSIGEILEKNSIPRLVTTTTRPARVGEIDGVDYYFRDFSEKDMDEFIEQTVYNKNRYGLTKAEVQTKLNQHDVVHVSLDKAGAQALQEAYPKESCIVFVEISEDEMIERMKKRGDPEKQINERVAFARATNELSAPEEADLIIKNIDKQDSADRIICYLSQKRKSKFF